MDLQICSFWWSLSCSWLYEGGRVLELWPGLSLIPGVESVSSISADWTGYMAFLYGNGPVLAVVWVWTDRTTTRIFPRCDQDWRRDGKIPEELGWRRESTSARFGDTGSPVAPALKESTPGRCWDTGSAVAPELMGALSPVLVRWVWSQKLLFCGLLIPRWF